MSEFDRLKKQKDDIVARHKAEAVKEMKSELEKVDGFLVGFFGLATDDNRPEGWSDMAAYERHMAIKTLLTWHAKVEGQQVTS